MDKSFHLLENISIMCGRNLSVRRTSLKLYIGSKESGIRNAKHVFTLISASINVIKTFLIDGIASGQQNQRIAILCDSESIRISDQDSHAPLGYAVSWFHHASSSIVREFLN